MFENVKFRLARTLVALVAAFSMFPFAAAQPSPSTSASELSKFFSDYFEERLRDEPEFATTVGRHEYDDRWTDLSTQGRERHRSHLEQRFDRLQKFSLNGLSDEDRLSVELLRYDLRTQRDAMDLETHLLRVGQMFGMHNRVYTVIDRMPAFTVKDCENIIARLRARSPKWKAEALPLRYSRTARCVNQSAASRKRTSTSDFPAYWAGSLASSTCRSSIRSSRPCTRSMRSRRSRR